MTIEIPAVQRCSSQRPLRSTRYTGAGLSRSVLIVALSMLVSTPAAPAKNYGPGVTDTEIKIGQTVPYSGPVSALSTIGRAELAYFEKINAEGGINGRKVKMISLDDAYSPPKTVEQVRRLVEKDQVLFLFSSVGTPTNSAIHKYVNSKKIPHLLISAGASKWGDPKHYPWTTPFPPPALYEGKILAKHLMERRRTRRSESCIRTMTSVKTGCAA